MTMSRRLAAVFEEERGSLAVITVARVRPQQGGSCDSSACGAMSNASLRAVSDRGHHATSVIHRIYLTAYLISRLHRGGSSLHLYYVVLIHDYVYVSCRTGWDLGGGLQLATI
jgi:hypothetical protein